MRFKPVYFRQPNRAIVEPHAGHALQLPPASLAIPLSQQREHPNAAPDHDGLNLRDRADDFNMHYAPSKLELCAAHAQEAALANLQKR